MQQDANPRKPQLETGTQLGAMSPTERMRYLLQHWSLEKPSIVGTLSRRSNGQWWLNDVTASDGRRKVYPIAGQEIPCNHVFVGGGDSDLHEGAKYSVDFELAPPAVQQQRNNPLLINAKGTTLRIAPGATASKHAPVPDAASRRAPPAETEQELLAEVADLQETARQLKDKNADAATQFHRKRKEVERLEKEADEFAAERDRRLAGLKHELDEQRAENQSALEAEKAQLEAELAQARERADDELGRLHSEVEAARSQHAKETERLMKQTRQLQEYAKGHADRLLALDLINEDQYSVLIGQVPTPPDDESAGWRTASDLPLGFADIVPTIQRYLYENDRIYPQALLSNFLALMLTGDFVILAGLSGAGKTMLVKSFAQATGNVPHIIPVKPNWTSAEDLTGYYNPLQRSYLTTPFLDALIAAQRDPSRLHLICLDEMNLARVEYYFADFLSALEEREEDPVIDLYSDEEAGHVRTEFKLFLDCLLDIGNRQGIQGLGDFLKHPEIVQALNDRLGIKDGESLLQMHARLRRMVAGVLNVPARLAVPPNARFIGTVNMDATTQFLSPKVLDRAHVIKFSSPLNYLKRVKDELRDNDHPNQGVRMPADDFPRERYPPFDPDKTDRLTETLRDWSQEFFEPIGIDIGMRLLRQALAFRQQWQRLVPEGQAKGVDFYVLNHLVRQKLLPRFFFNARQPSLRGEETIGTFVEDFNSALTTDAKLPGGAFSARDELRVLIERAKANDGNFNYWA